LKGQPTYKENQDNAKNAWCRLVEKAFAKYHGHYRDVKEMKATNALEALTGRKSQKYSTSEATLDGVQEFMEYGICMTGNISEGDNGVPSKVHSILNFYRNVQINDGSKVNLLEIQWNQSEPSLTGPFSNQDIDGWLTITDPEIRSLRLTAENKMISNHFDTIFITFEDWKKSFDIFVGCLV